jgi:hypothetical protein
MYCLFSRCLNDRAPNPESIQVEAKFEATATDTYLVRNRERDVHMMWTDVYDWEKSRQGKVRVGRASSQKDGKALMCAYQYQLIYDITHSLTHCSKF